MTLGSGTMLQNAALHPGRMPRGGAEHSDKGSAYVLQIWQSILDCLEDNRRALSDLWGGHLLFFRQLVRRPA